MKNVDLFDSYLNNCLSVEENKEFETRLNNDVVFNKAFTEHKLFVETLRLSAERNSLKKKLQGIHHSEFANDGKIISLNKPESFLQKYGKSIAVAASTSAIIMFGSIVFLNSQKHNTNEITDLKRDVLALKYSKDVLIEEIAKTNSKIHYAPANLEGSAFALNNKGYIITSCHMIKGADSVFIQNNTTERSLAKVVMSDSKLDFAILKIENSAVTKNWQVPFAFNDKLSDIGEKVYTLGYPRQDMVYGEGSLSSLSGFYNDTTMYQISIPVNPGNSGGPLLDEQGNVIGVVRGKNTNAEATGFAIKTNEIIKAINKFANDSIIKDITQLSKRSSLKNLKRTEQIKRINPYVFNVLVYKKD
ncbi:MAG: serine protease [Bacteroidota bacterium]|nr:serine protease [Bacteroidota bacterium]